MKIKKTRVSWEWPSGDPAFMLVPRPLLADLAVMLYNDLRVVCLRFQGLHYDDYVRQFGGVVSKSAKQEYPV